MIGIYQDNIVDYLKDHLGEHNIKTTSKNIVCKCPFCEYNEGEKSHYHLYISTEIPIFHCFRGKCNESGGLQKLFSKLSGYDTSEKYVDKEKIKQNLKSRTNVGQVKKKTRQVILPALNETLFSHKASYIKQRFKHSISNLQSIKGLVFDINEFIKLNNVVMDDRLTRVQDYLHSNFVGFVTENQSLLILRNIDGSSSFGFFKVIIQESSFLDYYKIHNSKKNSNTIILAEGIFDIFTEHIYDTLGLRHKSRLSAAAMGTSYKALVKSIVFHEQLFQPEVHILSDRDVHLNYYRKLKRENSYLIKSLTVYYNKSGKDFNHTIIDSEKFII